MMNTFLTLAFLFFVGSLGGWCLEVVFRKLTNAQHKWINPGFCTGPYLPIYGFGLCILYLIASLEPLSLVEHPVWNKVCLFAAMAVAMTVIEYIAGIICLKYFHVRLWDYRDQWGNIQGIICPLFSFFWAILGAVYYFLIHPRVLGGLEWLSRNLAFSFVIGLFFGVFLMDLAKSLHLMARLKKFADSNELILKLEAIKDDIRQHQEERALRNNFFRPYHSDKTLAEHLQEMRDSFEQRKRRKQ